MILNKLANSIGAVCLARRQDAMSADVIEQANGSAISGVGAPNPFGHDAAMPNLTFQQLNNGWNAEPNAPYPQVEVSDSLVRLTFFFNHQVFQAEEGEKGCLAFRNCSMWRLGPTSDHGWYLGQCRYSKAAPAWGEFYELLGEDDQRLKPADWQRLGPLTSGHRHFLFYLRDETFECFASEWVFERGSS